MSSLPIKFSLRPGYPDFLSLPWDHPLAEWPDHCTRLEEVQRGLSRHPVVFVNYDGNLFAIKELPPGLAEKEYTALCQMEELRLPVVTPVGHLAVSNRSGENSILITRFLDRSLPYRTLLQRSNPVQYREHFLDAIAGLLVQLHLAGIYWGDCSLSNTLFRRDAGALQAYLVDAETAKIYPQDFPAMLRYYDMEILEENIDGEVAEMIADDSVPEARPLAHMGGYIRVRYQALWDEITREDIINPGEHYRIQERIRALNMLGFSVGQVELASTENGDQLRLRVAVTDRNFHQDQLQSLTGLMVEEKQARKMMNEIQELNATLSQNNNRTTPLSVAAYHWLQDYYQPTIERLSSLIDENTSPGELYCNILEHKWYLSEKAQRDVGHLAATEDYLVRFSPKYEGIGVF